MDVWLVWESTLRGDRIEGVFSSKTLAEAEASAVAGFFERRTLDKGRLDNAPEEASP